MTLEPGTTLSPCVMLQPLTKPPAGFLETAAAMSSQIRLNMFLLLVGGVIPVVIAVAAWPFAGQRSHALGLWSLALAFWLMARGFGEPHGALAAEARGAELAGA